MQHESIKQGVSTQHQVSSAWDKKDVQRRLDVWLRNLPKIQEEEEENEEVWCETRQIEVLGSFLF